MDSTTIVLIFLVIVLIILSVYILIALNKKKPETGGDEKSFLLIQNQLQELSKVVDNKLGESHKSMQIQFGQSAKIISDVTEKLTKLDETNKQVIGFSEQLNNLQKVLTSQKQRGNLGEAGLQMVLENILPPNAFQLQYQFKDGDTVDAAIFTKDGIIPVDAKFSLENYSRIISEDDKERKKILEKEFKNDLKKRIDETSKYIKTKEGTLDFAFMFIPAEAIYYDLLVNEVGEVSVNTRSLIDYASKEKKVIIVSPTTFAAYLQTVLYGLRSLKMQEETKDIIKRVQNLGTHIQKYEAYMGKLGTNLSSTVGSYESARKEFTKIDKDVIKIGGAERELLDTVEVEKPREEE
ncbi:MAG: DNA recombination protein RmuC [Patescibacteria group bacterium]|nr:DNA recombination protein RmuC [Patescibacteria group bacterium]